MSERKEFTKLIGEVWGKRYSTVGSAQAKEFERYLKQGSADDAIWRAQERATASLGAEDVSPFILELLRQADLLGLSLTPDQVTYLVIDSLELPEGADEEAKQGIRQILDPLLESRASETTMNWTARVGPAIPILELFAFFRNLLELDRPQTAALVEHLMDPDEADELLRRRYLNRPDIIEFSKDAGGEAGRRVKVHDQPLVGNARQSLIRAISGHSTALFSARLVQVLLMTAYAIGSEPRSLNQVLQASSEEKVKIVTDALNHYRIHRLADSLVTNVQKRFYAEKDDTNLGNLTQILMDENNALPASVIVEAELQERIAKACVSSTSAYFKEFKTQYARDSVLRVSSPLIKALEEQLDHILEVLQANWKSPYSEAYRAIRKAVADIESSQKLQKVDEESSIIKMDFHQERQRVLGSLGTLNMKYSNLATDLLNRRRQDPNNPQRRLAALFACEAFYEHKAPSNEAEKWASLEGLLDYYIALIDSAVQAKDFLTREEDFE
jgi:hypothetical protein